MKLISIVNDRIDRIIPDAAVIYGSEVVWATIGGVIFVHELCSFSDICGCILMLGSAACAKADKIDTDSLMGYIPPWIPVIGSKFSSRQGKAFDV